MTDCTTSSCLMTIFVNLPMWLLVSFYFQSLVGTGFKKCQSYSRRAFAAVAFDWQTRDAAIRIFSTGKACHAIVSLPKTTVDAGHDRLAKVLVPWLLALRHLRSTSLVYRSFSLAI